MAPCAWVINPVCCSDWESHDPAIITAGTEYATTVLWAATGRRFGLCPVTVRPCGSGRPCGDGTLDWSGWAYSGGGWVPYLFNGTWYNCGCPGSCSCDPRCQVMLPQPVATVTEVLVGGVIVPTTAWRVDDNRWLVRTDGECWPECPDFDTDDGADVFTVTYSRGEPVPAALANAAGTLACEYAKACIGDSGCRLPSRVQTLARNGVTVSFVDVDELLDKGLTGITEVDAIIRAYNPNATTHRYRVLSPDLRLPRMVTQA